MVGVGLLADRLDRSVALLVVVVAAACCCVAVAVVADWDRVDLLGSVDLDLGTVHLHGGLHVEILGRCLRLAELVAAGHHFVPVPVVELGCLTVVEECYQGYHRHTASSQ